MSNNKKNDIPDTIKIILVGNSGVGKTSIINRFHNNSYKDNISATIAMNYVEKKVKIKGKKLTINIWDTAGQEKYKSVNKLFIKNSNIVIFVYGINSKESFNELTYWHECIDKELGEIPLLCLVGNKVDLVEMEEVKEEEGQELANQWGAFFAQLSAKCDAEGINTFFTEILSLFINNKRGIFPRNDSITINNSNGKKSQGCCGGDNSDKEKKEINDKMAFFGGKGTSFSIKNIIKTILGNENGTPKNEYITLYQYQYKYEKKRIINLNIFEIDEGCLNCLNENDNELNDIIKNCKIFFLVFDMGQKESFNDLKQYIEKINKNKNNKGKNIIYFLGISDESIINNGNEGITNEEAKKLANDIGGNFKKISLDDKNLFQSLIKSNIENYLNY